MAFEIKDGVLIKYTEEAGLTEVTIPDGVTVIGKSAFKDCTALTEINLPDSITAFGTDVFKDTLFVQKYSGDILVIGGQFLKCGKIRHLSQFRRD